MMIFGCIVCGTKSESTQKWLLADPELTLAKATDIAQAMEAADKGATGLKSEAAAMVDRVSQDRSAPPTMMEPCYRCG